MAQAERPDWQRVTANVEWLGKELEEEIEEAKIEKLFQQHRSGNGND